MRAGSGRRGRGSVRPSVRWLGPRRVDDHDARPATAAARRPRPAPRTAAYGPYRSATTAIVAAAIPTPAGWAICRCPWPGRAGRPGTSRRPRVRWRRCCSPPRPGQAKRDASRTGAGERGQGAEDHGAPTSPASRTSRSPRRSVTSPGHQRQADAGHRCGGHQAGLGQAEPARVQARIRNAGPCTITAVEAWARVLAPSIAQRRDVATSATAWLLTPPIQRAPGWVPGDISTRGV